jgi:metallo-beta-lactamase family protein
MKKPAITFYGGVGTATGANFLLELAGKRLLIDCGLLQGVHGADEWNRQPFAYDLSTIEALIVTHAHMDHIGRIPKLVRDGFRGPIYSTPATLDIARLMYDDALGLMERSQNETGLEAFYSRENVVQAIAQWKTIEYHTPFDLGGGITLTFKDAGHILGSAMCWFEHGHHKIVFTGDVGNTPALFLRDTESLTGATHVVTESVYGDRNHESKEERRRKLTEAIKDTVDHRRALIIPAFSLERTQDMLYEINKLVEQKTIDQVPVYLDSPLASKITVLYREYTRYFKEEAKKHIADGDDLFHFPRLYITKNIAQSDAIQQVDNPKIIIAGSGMSNGGRIARHEKYLLPDPATTLLLVGYQSLGTLGRQLWDGAKKVEIDGEIVPVKARVQMISGYSSHKDSDHLVEMVATGQGSLKKVFIAMGEPKSSLFLAQKIRDNTGINALYPELGSTHEL